MQPTTDQSLPSFGVVIPTKNCRPYLPAHLDGLKNWLDLAAEVVVVDSFSTDGTLEYLRENLKHPQTTFSTHPPGLYASWNHGIAQVKSTFVFIATTGDLITRAGMESLLRTARDLDCDLVISKPAFRDPDGRPMGDSSWPIDDMIATLELTAPAKLTKLQAVLFAALSTRASGALLGSSASNIYRTEVFKRLPFPVNFGTTGDAFWGWQHAAEVSWGVTPEKVSSFLIHPPNVSAAEKKSHHAAPRGDQIIKVAMENWRRTGLISDEELACLHWPDLMAWLGACLDAKSAFDHDRHGSIPWVLNPIAWRNRLKRERAVTQLQKIKQQALNSLAKRG